MATLKIFTWEKTIIVKLDHLDLNKNDDFFYDIPWKEEYDVI